MAEKSLLFVNDNANRSAFHLVSADALDSSHLDKSGGLVRDSVEKHLGAIEHVDQSIKYAKRAIKDGQENQLYFNMLTIYHVRADQTNKLEEQLKYTLLGLSYTTTYRWQNPTLIRLE